MIQLLSLKIGPRTKLQANPPRMSHLPETELLEKLTISSIEVGALYAHYRDLQNPYRVIALGMIEATEEPSVIYRKDDSSVVWVRTIKSWTEMVTVEETQVPRFQKIEQL